MVAPEMRFSTEIDRWGNSPVEAVPVADVASSFSGLARIASGELRLRESDESECSPSDNAAFLASYGDAYIDLNELAIALDLFYLGRLDEVDPENICNELRELVPGRPLISQLTSDDVKSALNGLDAADRFVIRCAHAQFDTVHRSAAQRLSEEELDSIRHQVQTPYCEALERLSIIVFKLL